MVEVIKENLVGENICFDVRLGFIFNFVIYKVGNFKILI